MGIHHNNDEVSSYVMPSSLYEVLAKYAHNKRSDRAFLEDARSERIFTYRMAFDAVDAWHSVLAAVVPLAQTAVLIDLADPLSFGVAYLAVISAGKRAIPIDPGSPATELNRLSGLIGGAGLVISDRADFEGAVDLPPIIAIKREDGMPATADNRSLNSGPTEGGSAVLFTSGSTGTPKGVELPETQLLYVGFGIATHNKLTENDRGFNSLPLFHVNAEVVGLIATLIAGATLVLDDRFHREGFWELLQARRITWLNAAPAILAILSRGDARMEHLNTLRFIRSASAPLPDAVRESMRSVELVVSYGMTEGASQITATPLGEPRRPGSVGVPVGAELEIRDESGRIAVTGEIGTVWIRGEGVITHYLFDRASERFDSEGWLNTSDLGKVDDDGYVYLLGRADDVINRGGEKVYPAEIEDVLLQNKYVREVVVAAKPDAILHQVPVAYVIPTGDSMDATQQVEFKKDLLALCDAKLTRFKRPVAIIVVEDLPRAPTGKIQRVKVRELAVS